MTAWLETEQPCWHFDSKFKAVWSLMRLVPDSVTYLEGTTLPECGRAPGERPSPPSHPSLSVDTWRPLPDLTYIYFFLRFFFFINTLEIHLRYPGYVYSSLAL